MGRNNFIKQVKNVKVFQETEEEPFKKKKDPI